MQIELRMTGILREHLPPEAKRGRITMELIEQSSVLDVMGQLKLPEEGRYLTSLNGELVVIDARSTTQLQANDKLVIMPPLTGG